MLRVHSRPRLLPFLSTGRFPERHYTRPSVRLNLWMSTLVLSQWLVLRRLRQASFLSNEMRAVYPSPIQCANHLVPQPYPQASSRSIFTSRMDHPNQLSTRLALLWLLSHPPTSSDSITLALKRSMSGVWDSSCVRVRRYVALLSPRIGDNLDFDISRNQPTA